jgi:hypothetical protein
VLRRALPHETSHDILNAPEGTSAPAVCQSSGSFHCHVTYCSATVTKIISVRQVNEMEKEFGFAVDLNDKLVKIRKEQFTLRT